MSAAAASETRPSIFEETVQKAKAWIKPLGIYLGALAVCLVEYNQVGVQLDTTDWRIKASVSAIPLLLALIFHGIPGWVRRRKINVSTNLG